MAKRPRTARTARTTRKASKARKALKSPRKALGTTVRHRAGRVARAGVARARAAAPADAAAMTKGIDVSHHQGTIDWAAVADAGIRYAFIKATQGAGFIDARFAENWRGAGQRGIVRGAYLFFDPEATPRKQFDNFTNVVTLGAGDLAPALDIETDGQDWASLPKTKRLPAVLELLSLLESHYGITPIVYTNKRSIDDIFGSKPDGLTDFPLWVASFKKNPPPTLPAGWTEWKHWQQSDKGKVPGITGDVDLDRCIGEPGPVLPTLAIDTIETIETTETTESIETSASMEPMAFGTGISVDAGPTAIDIATPLPDKVRALWDILGRVVADLDASASAAKQRIIKMFLLHLAGHESQLRTRAQDANGPARSLFQLEAHRAKDAGQHARAVNLMGMLASATGNGAGDLNAAFNALPAFDAAHPNQSAFFPSGNLIEAMLIANDLFAAYLVRIDFRRFAAPIPESNEAQAEYWLKFWKGTASNPEAVKKQFLDDCKRVDPHIPA
jgi:lysozyme